MYAGLLSDHAYRCQCSDHPFIRGNDEGGLLHEEEETDGLEHAFGRQKLENLVVVVQGPAMRGGPVAQFLIRFGQGYVEALLAPP